MPSFYASGNATLQDGANTTVGATTSTLITFPALAVASSYAIYGEVSGFESTGPNAYASNLVALVRSTGVATTLVSSTQFDATADAGIVASTFQVTVAGNNIIVSATGVIALTINWTCTCSIQISQ